MHRQVAEDQAPSGNYRPPLGRRRGRLIGNRVPVGRGRASMVMDLQPFGAPQGDQVERCTGARLPSREDREVGIRLVGSVPGLDGLPDRRCLGRRPRAAGLQRCPVGRHTAAALVHPVHAAEAEGEEEAPTQAEATGNDLLRICRRGRGPPGRGEGRPSERRGANGPERFCRTLGVLTQAAGPNDGERRTHRPSTSVQRRRRSQGKRRKSRARQAVGCERRRRVPRCPSVATQYQWRHRGYGPTSRRVGRYVRYEPAVVRAWSTAQE